MDSNTLYSSSVPIGIHEEATDYIDPSNTSAPVQFIGIGPNGIQIHDPSKPSSKSIQNLTFRNICNIIFNEYFAVTKEENKVPKKFIWSLFSQLLSNEKTRNLWLNHGKATLISRYFKQWILHQSKTRDIIGSQQFLYSSQPSPSYMFPDGSIGPLGNELIPLKEKKRQNKKIKGPKVIISQHFCYVRFRCDDPNWALSQEGQQEYFNYTEAHLPVLTLAHITSKELVESSLEDVRMYNTKRLMVARSDFDRPKKLKMNPEITLQMNSDNNNPPKRSRSPLFNFHSQDDGVSIVFPRLSDVSRLDSLRIVSNELRIVTINGTFNNDEQGNFSILVRPRTGRALTLPPTISTDPETRNSTIHFVYEKPSQWKVSSDGQNISPIPFSPVLFSQSPLPLKHSNSILVPPNVQFISPHSS